MALKWVIWKDDDGSGMCLEKDSYLLIGFCNNAEIITTFETNSTNEARRKYDEHLGFGVRDDLVPDIVFDDNGKVISG